MLNALSQLRIIDLSRIRSGPTCVRIFADFGADVIRVEPPPGLDPNDGMPSADRFSGDFQNLNRNKRSLTLNLKTQAGREILLKLVRTADVVVENWRPDVKHRLGLHYDALREINPKVILASISGFGQDGPYAKRPGFDQIIQGMGGLMSVTGLPGQGPIRAGLAVADSSAGLYAAVGILVALAERSTSGNGQWVHTSLLHSLIAMMDFQCARYLNDGDIPVQMGNDHPTSSPMGLFAAADGMLNLGASGEGNWKRFCAVVDRPMWLEDPDFADEHLRAKNRERLNREIQRVFQQETVDHWVQTLNAAGVPCGPVYSIPEVFTDPQVQHCEVTKEVTAGNGKAMKLITEPVVLDRTPAKIDLAAPNRGEHTEEILSDLGYSVDEVQALREEGVV